MIDKKSLNFSTKAIRNTDIATDYVLILVFVFMCTIGILIFYNMK